MARKKKKDATEAVPDNVASQGDKADELQRRLIAGEALEGETVKDATVDKDGNVIVDPASAQKATTPDLTGSPAANQDNNAQSADKTFPRVDPGSVDLPVTDATNQDQGDVATLQQRLSALEGKYNTEISRLTTALKSSENIIQSQEALIKNLQAGNGGQDAQAAAADTGKAFDSLNPDEYSSYGSEMEKMAATINEMGQTIHALRQHIASNKGSGTQGGDDRIAKVEQTVQNLTGTVQLTAKQAYYQALDSAIIDAQGKPNWEQINHDPRFAQWLAGIEPMTGIPRKAILLKANQEMNAERVISIFSEFKRSLQGGTPQPGQEISDLAAQALPGTAAASGDEVDPNATKQGLVTTEQFNKAKNDFIQGRITEADFDKVSNGYQNSIAQGWIQP
jgi:hypothetical protein